MKNIILILTIMLIVMSCSEHECKEYKFAYSEFSKTEVFVYTYQEHTYLQFGSGSGQWGVHDPDCKHPDHKIYQEMHCSGDNP